MSLGRAVARVAQRSPRAVATFDEHGSQTYGELDERTNQLAHALVTRFRVEPGDRIAVLMANRPAVVEMLVAVHKAGAVYVGLNFRMDDADLAAVFDNAEPRLLVTETGFVEQARQLARKFDIDVVDVDGPVSAALLEAGSSQPPPSMQQARPTDHACIVYTSGTTGRPKGVLFDHAAMAQHATVACLEYEITARSRYLIQIPHNSSVNITIAPCLLAGAAVGFADSRSFDPDRFAHLAAQTGSTHTFLVPTQLMRVLDQLPPGDQRLSSMSTLGYGSSPIAPDRLGDLVDRFGPIFIQLYGMAEIASIGTLLRKRDHVRALGPDPQLLRSCGQPSFVEEVRVVDDDGRTVAVGERGEVVFSGPHTMLGYYRDPDRTAEVLRDGWMYSGDVAEVDDEGFVYIVDRKKHLIIRGGLNIAPTEIENVLYRHPAVLEAAAVGTPDPEWGERIVAVVALRASSTASTASSDAQAVTADELLRFVADSDLASIKRPEEVKIVDSLPKNAVGKIDKAAVRRQFWSGDRQV